jgi:hypothetical protein
LGEWQYFLDIKVARSEQGFPLLQRKYVPDILVEKGVLGAKLVDNLMDPNTLDRRSMSGLKPWTI